MEYSYCKNCGQEYTADKITSAFCSDGCQEAYYHFATEPIDDSRYEV